MTQPVLGRASVSGGRSQPQSPPSAAAPAFAPPGRGPRRGIAVGRLVVIQLAVVAVLLAAGTRSMPLVVATAATVLIIAVPLFLRVRGRWYTELLGARRRLRRRRQRSTVLAPGYEVTAREHDGAVIGVGFDYGGWFAAAAVAPPGNLAAARPAHIPLDRVARLLLDGSVPVSAVQVVSWAVPAPHYVVSHLAACVESYRQLSVDQFASTPAALAGRTWVAVRLDLPRRHRTHRGHRRCGRKRVLRRAAQAQPEAGPRPAFRPRAAPRPEAPQRRGRHVRRAQPTRGTQPVEEWTSWTSGQSPPRRRSRWSRLPANVTAE